MTDRTPEHPNTRTPEHLNTVRRREGMSFRGPGSRMQWDWMTVGTSLVLVTLSGLLLYGCGAGNVPGLRTGGSTGRTDALPVTDASREFRLVVQFDHIQELLLDPALTEEGRLSA